MELSSSDKERIQHQYDALAKKTLVGEAKSHRRTLAKRAAREVTFSDLSESELAQLFTTDEYESDYFRFQVSGFDVLVKNELLAEALNALPETQEWCSKLVGTYDKKKVSSNYNADILGVGKGQGTSSSTEEKRIIKPEEFAYLKDVVCVFPNGYKRLQKANYYEDKTFTDRM